MPRKKAAAGGVNLGRPAKKGPMMYAGGSKRFNEATGQYRGKAPPPKGARAPYPMPTFGKGPAGPGKMVAGRAGPQGRAVGYGKTPAAARRGAVAGAGRAAALQQMQKAMTKRASMRGAIGKGGGPGRANRQAMRNTARRAR